MPFGTNSNKKMMFSSIETTIVQLYIINFNLKEKIVRRDDFWTDHCIKYLQILKIYLCLSSSLMILLCCIFYWKHDS